MNALENLKANVDANTAAVQHVADAVDAERVVILDELAKLQANAGDPIAVQAAADSIQASTNRLEQITNTIGQIDKPLPPA